MLLGIGELAALSTACLWAVSSYTYSRVGRRVGANEVTLLRLPFQLVFVAFLCALLGADVLLSPAALGWLVASGAVGAAFGDLLLYRSVMIIGPSLAILLLCLNASFTALFGWIFLGEALSLQTIGGIALATAGVGWVVTGRSESALLPGQEAPTGKALALGILMALTAGAVVAISFILLKMGLRDGADPLWAAFIRILTATVLLWALGLARGWSKQSVRKILATPSLFWTLSWAALFGGTGMWLANLAMRNISAGVAATLIALQPILVTLLNAVLTRRAPSARIAAGSLAAFVGTALVCLR